MASAAAPVRSAASPAAPVRARGAQGAGEIRIIGGQWKRTRLPVPQ
ncbi:MAG: 16S rRNA (guanine(966)-N(2))-methyltransferase RsmD, partial [Burkholderiaceae bacterium]|nr:16S rRNA (guanine(966)-N(2))-methyltransferase RsmD [Burkholderiaceae bacterium]